MENLRKFEEFTLFKKNEPTLIDKIIKAHKNGLIEFEQSDDFKESEGPDEYVKGQPYHGPKYNSDEYPDQIIQLYDFDFEGKHYTFKVVCDNYMRVVSKELLEDGVKLNIDPSVLRELTDYTSKIK